MEDRRIKRLEKSVVCILSDYADNEPGSFEGHGVLIGDSGVIVTACHLFLGKDDDENNGETADVGSEDDDEDSIEEADGDSEDGDEDSIEKADDDSEDGDEDNDEKADGESEEYKKKRFVLMKKTDDIVKVALLKGKYKGEYSAKIKHLDLAHDIALLKIVRSYDGNGDRKKFKYVKWVAHDVTIGQAVYMATTSDGRNLELSKGTIEYEKRLYRDLPQEKVKEIAFFSKDAPLVQVINLHGIQGCSGTPVFTEHGHLVGVYSFGFGRRDFVVHPTIMQTSCDKDKSKDDKKKRGKEEHDEQVEMAVDEEDVQAVADDEPAPVIATDRGRKDRSLKRKK